MPTCCTCRCACARAVRVLGCVSEGVWVRACVLENGGKIGRANAMPWDIIGGVANRVAQQGGCGGRASRGEEVWSRVRGRVA
jgi:hypothetical protein